MKNFRYIYNECTYLVEKCDKNEKSVNDYGYTYKSRIKDLGEKKVELNELVDKDNNTEFFSCKIVEVDDPTKKIDFENPFYFNEPFFNRMVKISGDKDSIVITSSLKKNEIITDLVDTSRIVIKGENDYAEEWLLYDLPCQVNIDNIISAIENLNVDRFFNGFPEYSKPIKKEKKM